MKNVTMDEMREAEHEQAAKEAANEARIDEILEGLRDFEK